MRGGCDEKGQEGAGGASISTHARLDIEFCGRYLSEPTPTTLRIEDDIPNRSYNHDFRNRPR